jgi:hypothetical protein
MFAIQKARNWDVALIKLVRWLRVLLRSSEIGCFSHNYS